MMKKIEKTLSLNRIKTIVFAKPLLTWNNNVIVAFNPVVLLINEEIT